MLRKFNTDYTSDKNGDLFHWTTKTRVKIGASAWYTTPPECEIAIENSLIKLGAIDNAEVWVFVSPFESVSNRFKDRAHSICRRSHDAAGIRNIKVGIDELLKSDAANFDAMQLISQVVSVSAEDKNGQFITLNLQHNLSARQHAGFHGMFGHSTIKDVSFHSMELMFHDEDNGQRVSWIADVDRDFNIHLADVSASIAEISRRVGQVFKALRRSMRLENPPSESRPR